jgi:hypothetical protein
MEKSDFNFSYSGFGHYIVTYTSPKTGKKWSKVIDQMDLIDRTKNEDNPKQKDLEMLKYIIKNA